MLDGGRLELFIEPGGQPIHVSTSPRGRRFLPSDPDGEGVDNGVPAYAATGLGPAACPPTGRLGGGLTRINVA